LGTSRAVGISFGAWSWPLTSVWCGGQRMGGAVLPQYAFMARCSGGGEHRDRLSFIRSVTSTCIGNQGGHFGQLFLYLIVQIGHYFELNRVQFISSQCVLISPPTPPSKWPLFKTFPQQTSIYFPTPSCSPEPKSHSAFESPSITSSETLQRQWKLIVSFQTLSRHRTVTVAKFYKVKASVSLLYRS